MCAMYAYTKTRMYIKILSTVILANISIIGRFRNNAVNKEFKLTFTVLKPL